MRANRGDFLGQVDADGTPGDAAAAADTSRAAELVYPRSQLVREPLPVTVFDLRAEVDAVDMGVFEREARVPLAHAAAHVAVDFFLVDHGVAKASRADHRAVGTGKASRGDVLPARVFGFVVEQAGQVGGIEAPLHTGSASFDAVFCRRGFIVGGGRQAELGGNGLAGGRAGAHHEALFQFGQRNIKAGRRCRTRLHRDAKAGWRGAGAVDGDQKRIFAPGLVVSVVKTVVQKNPILHGECGEVARTHADKGEARRGRRYFADLEATVRATYFEEGFLGCEKKRFERTRPVDHAK